MLKNKQILTEILEDKQRFSYKSEKKRIEPKHLQLRCYNLTGTLMIIFNAECKMLPAGKSHIFSLESFEHILYFISIHFNHGYSAS